MQSKKKKVATAITAATLAVVMALTGTFAWQAISQQARNEVITYSNPGGRLHDDFDGSNKDIYVENFTDPLLDGADIFARVRLDEYMEIGVGAGLKPGDAGYDDIKEAKSVVDGAVINDPKTWTTHVPSASNVAESANPFHKYWTWDMGGETVYMPTFNMNKDSLEADINGTLEGTVAGDETYYDDYKTYVLGDPTYGVENGYEIWDNDANDTDELKTNSINIEDVITKDSTTTAVVEGTYGTNVLINKGTLSGTTYSGVTHEAKATLGSTVLTMEQWKALGSPIGEYWVYDTDGWAYWAAPIKPGTATGLLLDGISEKREPDDDSYYAINVVAQFASRGDWGQEDGTGFYDTAAGLPPSDDAYTLLNKIAGLDPTVRSVTIAGDDRVYALADQALTLEATVNVAYGTGDPAETAIDWTIEPVASTATFAAGDPYTFADGVFTPTADAEGLTYRVTATSAYDPNFYDSVEIYVLPEEMKPLIDAEVGDEVTIDGIGWWVVAKEGSQTLLWATGAVIENVPFDDNSAVWANSNLRAYLNDEYLETLPILSRHAVNTTISTVSSYDRTIDPLPFLESKDKLFLLTEADVFGTANGVDTADEREYTLGKAEILVTDEMKASSTGYGSWLRSPYYSGSTYGVACVDSDGNATSVSYDYATAGTRPALWVELLPFKADTVTVTAEGDATELKLGESLKFSAEVTLNGSPISNQNVTWSVVGGSEGTSITADGMLTVSADEVGGAELTVIATSVEDNRVVGEYTIIAKPNKPNTITVNGADSVNAGSSYAYTVTVDPEDASTSVTWSIESGAEDSTSIDADTGELTVATAQTHNSSIVIRATSTLDSNKYGEKTVTVTNGAPSSLTVSGSSSVDAGSSATYSVSVSPSGANNSVTWSIASGASYSSITSAGRLTVNSSATHGSSITIRATSTKNTSVYDDHTVTVVNTPTGLTVSGSSSVNAGSSATYSVSVSPSGANNSVTWSIRSGASYGSITSAGQLTVNSSATHNSTIVIRATSTANTGVYKDYTVTVANGAPTGLTINGFSGVNMSNTFLYTVTATPSGANNSVTWSITSGASYGSITSAGQLTVNSSAPNNATITIRATSKLNPNVYAEKTVTVT